MGGTGATPAPTGTGGDTPTAPTTTGADTATCGRETLMLSPRPKLRPTLRLTGTETGTAGGGDTAMDTGLTDTDTDTAGGGTRSIQLKKSSILPHIEFNVQSSSIPPW